MVSLVGGDCLLVPMLPSDQSHHRVGFHGNFLVTLYGEEGEGGWEGGRETPPFFGVGQTRYL